MSEEIKRWDDDLSPEARDLFIKMLPNYHERLHQINKIPISVLIWGPSPSSQSPIGRIRRELRQLLRQKGNLAMFSEEICDPNSEFSVRLQQLIQAEQFDLIISIPETPGSIGEIHDFANDIRVNKKILIFLDESYAGGYSAQSLRSISCLISSEIVTYSPSCIDRILEFSLNTVNQIREYKYITNGRL